MLMGIEIFKFRLWGAEKMRFKVGNPALCLKACPDKPFYISKAQFVLGILKSETPFTLEYLSLFHKRKSLVTRSALRTQCSANLEGVMTV